MSYTDPNALYQINEPAVAAYTDYNGGLGGDDSGPDTGAPPDDGGGPPPDPGIVDGLAPPTDGTGTGTTKTPAYPDYTGANSVNLTAGQPYPGDSYAAAGMTVPPSPASVAPDDYTLQQMIASANAVNQNAGKPYPGDIAAAAGMTLPNATPASPNPGTGVTIPAAGTGSTADQFKAEFERKFGYFDDRYNSMANMEQNLLRGDQVIVPQAEYMAQFDPNLKRELAAIQGAPDFYRSQNAADWATAHNGEIANRIARGEFGVPGAAAAAGGQGYNGGLGRQPQGGASGSFNDAAVQNLLSQRAAEIKNPIDNAHALMTDQMRTGVADALAQLGATGIRQGIDGYGNLTLDWTAKSGTPMQLTESLVNYAGALQQLRDAVARQSPAAPAAAGGGGYPPRGGGYPPRGNGGNGGITGGAPPPVMPTGASVTNDIGSSAGYDTLAAQRLAAFDRMGPGGTQPNVPRSVASAVAYAPAIYPGGYSPYDQ